MDNDLIRKALLYPETVALIGASDTATRLTARPQSFLSKHGFGGTVFPVNPRRETVQGLPSYSSVRDIPEPVDHAYILLGADPALAALEECAAAKVKVVSMLADGFAESGGEGILRQQRLVAIARAADMLVIGPNSTGVVETGRGFACTTNAAFGLDKLIHGKFAVLSQSGSMIGAVLSRGAAVGKHFSSFISVGNEACAGVGEIGQLLVEDPEIDGFLLFLETIRHPEAVEEFAALARAAGKVIVAYLVGKSDAGKALALSHTGAMAGGARAIRSFLKAQGIVIADSFEALIEMPQALRLKSRLAGRPRTATVVTTTGGGGGMVYDLIGLRKVKLAGMSQAVADKLALSDINIKPGPLVDVTLAGTKYETMKAVMTELMTDPDVGLIVTAIGSSSQFNPELAVRPIIDARDEVGESGAPVVAIPLPDAPDSLLRLNNGGIPAFRTVESCAESVAKLLQETHGAGRFNGELPEAVFAMHKGVPALYQGMTGALNEVAAGKMFQALGLDLPEMLVLGLKDPLPEQIPFDGPYVVKMVSADILHKSEIGAVRVGLADRAAVTAAIEEMRNSVRLHVPNARIDGVLIQKMERGLGEAIIGLTRDPVVGPIITVGAGGVLAEIYHDISIRPAPVSPESAEAMIAEVKGFAQLRGFRNATKGDLEALAVAVAQISLLARDPRIEEAEVNPVLVREAGRGVVVLDALIRLSDDNNLTGRVDS